MTEGSHGGAALSSLESQRRRGTGALAGMAQLVGVPFCAWKVVGSIPSQGTFLGCRFGPSDLMCQRQPINISVSHRCLYPSISPSLPPSLKSMSMSLGEEKNKK